jgi:hypothetical protein
MEQWLKKKEKHLHKKIGQANMPGLFFYNNNIEILCLFPLFNGNTRKNDYLVFKFQEGIE